VISSNIATPVVGNQLERRLIYKRQEPTKKPAEKPKETTPKEKQPKKGLPAKEENDPPPDLKPPVDEKVPDPPTGNPKIPIDSKKSDANLPDLDERSIIS